MKALMKALPALLVVVVLAAASFYVVILVAHLLVRAVAAVWQIT